MSDATNLRAPVLVTGAAGFVGGAVVRGLRDRGWAVRAAVRALSAGHHEDRTIAVGDIGPLTDWSRALAGASAIVHCAARVHQLHDASDDPLGAFRKTNVAGTLALAVNAARSGVRRFVFISSIGVNGAETTGTPFRAGDAPAPHSPYAVSKHEAEIGLHAIATETAMEIVVVRPPLVYGPGAPGNFAALLRAVKRGWPLPFGAIHNRRAFIAIDNLVDFVATALAHPAPLSGTFLVSDGEDISTSDLLRRTASALGHPARLLAVPARWIRGAASAVGRAELGQRLCGSLEVDIESSCIALGWRPPVKIDEALVRTTQHFHGGEQSATPQRGDNRRR